MTESATTCEHAPQPAGSALSCVQEVPVQTATVGIFAQYTRISEGLAQYLVAQRFRAITLDCAHKPMREAVLSALTTVKPDVVVLVISTHSTEWLDVLSLLHTHYPATKILVIADYTMPSLIKLILKSGAHGYLLAMPSPSVMIAALEHLIEGMAVLDKQLAYIQPLLDQTLTSSIAVV